MQSFRLQASIKASKRGSVVGSMPVHLQQSDLDGACGPHCALTALMVFGIVHRDDPDGLPRSRKKARDRALAPYGTQLLSRNLRRATPTFGRIR